MKTSQVAISLLALFGLFSALTSFLPAAAPQGTAKPHGINGCDPGVPPLILSDMGQVPITFYTETESSADEEVYIVSFMPPKPLMVQVDGASQNIPLGFRTLHEVTFRYNVSGNQLTGKFNTNADPANPGMGGVAFDPLVFFGTYDANAETLPIQVVEMPPPTQTTRSALFLAQFKGLTVGFKLSDQ